MFQRLLVLRQFNLYCSELARRIQTNQFFQILFQQSYLPQKLVSVEETTEKPKPQVPTTPAEPTPDKPVTSTSVPVKEEAPTLPATGEKSTAASVAAGAAMVTSALALFGISTYKRKH